MMKLMLGLAFMLSSNGIALAQCEMPVAVRELLENPAMQRQLFETQAQRDTRAAAFKKALAQFPDNYSILWKWEIEKGIKPSSSAQSILEGKQMEDPSMDKEI